MARMRGTDHKPAAMFSYVSAEERVPHDHPLRAIRTFVDEILREMTREFDALYARHGRPSIPPERLLRAQLLQVLDHAEAVERHEGDAEDRRDPLTDCRSITVGVPR